jgi:hypothetical protein
MTKSRWKKLATNILRPFGSSVRDLFPIVAVLAFFQIVVFRQPLQNFDQILIGFCFVCVGLTLFVYGLELGLFPLGEQMAYAFAKKRVVTWLIVFAFALGFGTTFAEPALIAVAGKAAELSSLEAPQEQQQTLRDSYSLALRTTVAISVGLALVLGVLRILFGWRLHYLIIGGYALVMILTPFAPSSIVAIAYDSGGVTTSTITVPLTTALGVGLASSIRGRSPLLDGFGLIALASLTPIILVLVFGMVWS